MAPTTLEISIDVAAWASCRATADELPALRKSPGKLGDEPMANGLLRHVDEQTVVGVAAVLKAIRDSSLDPSGFARWSVLAAPRFLGRAKFEAAFPQYQAEGAWGVSPHLIPGHSLHSPSGTVSQAIHAHGANLGIGGTPGGERDALLVAATWLDAGWAEGVWVVMTSRDPFTTGKVAVSEPGDYRAIALALAPSRVEHSGPKIQVGPRSITLESVDAEVLEWLDPTPIGWRIDPGHAGPRPSHQLPARTRELT